MGYLTDKEGDDFISNHFIPKAIRLDLCCDCVHSQGEGRFKCPKTKREGGQYRARSCKHFEYKKSEDMFKNTYKTEETWNKLCYKVLDKSNYIMHDSEKYYSLDDVTCKYTDVDYWMETQITIHISDDMCKAGVVLSKSYSKSFGKLYKHMSRKHQLISGNTVFEFDLNENFTLDDLVALLADLESFFFFFIYNNKCTDLWDEFRGWWRNVFPIRETLTVEERKKELYKYLRDRCGIFPL